MANYSHAGEHSILQSVSPLATFLKLTSLGFIIGVGVVGNFLISILLIKDKSLHRPPYYFLLDLCASDILRSAICFPFVFTSVKNGSAWTYGTLTCKVIAFLGVLACFHTAFMLFCVSVTRYLAIAHHRFYTKRLTFWTCLAVICMVWTLSVAMAFPPVLDVGTYSFIREEDQCTFQHRSFRANDSLGFMLLLALILLATQLVYLKLIFFVHDRRKMKPVQFWGTNPFPTPPPPACQDGATGGLAHGASSAMPSEPHTPGISFMARVRVRVTPHGVPSMWEQVGRGSQRGCAPLRAGKRASHLLGVKRQWGPFP
uniref:G protein-coupled receptor 85 n=1 Tax=Paramormyrops kingsleyae TaxID=1676925 RepID=A0A3B3SIX9_9TELE